MASKRVSIGLTDEERTSWEKAAGGGYLQDWIRDTCNVAAGLRARQWIRIPDWTETATVALASAAALTFVAKLASDPEVAGRSTGEFSNIITGLLDTMRLYETERIHLSERVVQLESALKIYKALKEYEKPPDEPPPGDAA